jgi:hypothetical protein
MNAWIANHHLSVQKDSEFVEELSQLTDRQLRRGANELVNILEENDYPGGVEKTIAKSIQFVLQEEQRRYLEEAQ